jgi:hypothetical protein
MAANQLGASFRAPRAKLLYQALVVWLGHAFSTRLETTTAAFSLLDGPGCKSVGAKSLSLTNIVPKTILPLSMVLAIVPGLNNQAKAVDIFELQITSGKAGHSLECSHVLYAGYNYNSFGRNQPRVPRSDGLIHA